MHIGLVETQTEKPRHVSWSKQEERDAIITQTQ